MTPVKGPQRKHPMPWFPFDAEEFLSTSTFILMSLEGRGAYMTLCAWQWLEGFLPGEARELRKLLGGMTAKDFKKLWVGEIGTHFPQLLDGTRQNPQIAEARQHQSWKRDRQIEGGRRGGRVKNPEASFEDQNQATLEEGKQAEPVATPKHKVSLSSSSTPTSNQKERNGISEDAVKRVFTYWEERRRKVLKLKVSVPMKFTDKRAARIRARMEEGYAEEVLREAIDGCLRTKFNREGGHTDIELICRDQAHVERYKGKRGRRKKGGSDAGLEHLG